jgi:hypothetical protein
LCHARTMPLQNTVIYGSQMRTVLIVVASARAIHGTELRITASIEHLERATVGVFFLVYFPQHRARTVSFFVSFLLIARHEPVG